MDPIAATDLAYHLSLGIGGMGCAVGLGLVGYAAVQGISRQPESSGKIQTCMIIMSAFIEAITIYILISIFLSKH